MAFQGIQWTDETKSRREDPAKAERIRQEIAESKNRSASTGRYAVTSNNSDKKKSKGAS